jgi:tRNA-specific 2-thiouridylase
MPQFRHPYGVVAPKEKRLVARDKILVGVSSQGILSRLSAIFLKESHDVSLLHVRLGPLSLKAMGWRPLHVDEEKALRSWCETHSFELHISSLEKESDVFFEALALQNLGMCWKPELAALFHSQFLIPQLLTFADKHSFERVSLGYRARISLEKDVGYSLWRSKDLEIDQSYLLSFVPKTLMPKLLLPLGHIKGPELQRLCREKDLFLVKNKEKEMFEETSSLGSWKDYLGDLDTRALSRVKQKGYVIDSKHLVLGEHSGLMYASVGSREGLPSLLQVPSDFCVVGFDLMKQWMLLGAPELLDKRACLISKVHWTSDRPRMDRDSDVELRLHGDSTLFQGRARLLLDSMLQFEVAPGTPQFRPKVGDIVSLYRGSHCLGGAQVLETFL